MTKTKIFYYVRKLLRFVFLVVAGFALYLLYWKIHSDSVLLTRITFGGVLQRLINESEWQRETMRAERRRNEEDEGRNYRRLGSFLGRPGKHAFAPHNQILLEMTKTGLDIVRLSRTHSIPELRQSYDSRLRGVHSDSFVTSSESKESGASSSDESQERINDVMVVPNVVHYVWLGTDLRFTFVHYLSFLSVHRIIKPDFIFVHGEVGPVAGEWWNRTKEEVDNIYHVATATTSDFAPSGRRLRYKAHASDILRVRILYHFGGIYLDADVIVLKSFETLRRYSTVMGRESFHGVCNGIILSSKHAPFTWMLLEQYKDYSGFTEWWSYRSVMVPHLLASKYPQLIHVEETTLNRPNWYELRKIYYEQYDWSENYAVHLWLRVQNGWDPSKIARNPRDVDCTRTTFAEIARYVLYGSTRIRC